MASLDENALICDFAETYRIYDYRELPLRSAAIYAAGLRENSRIKQKLAKEPASQEIILLACIADRLSYILHGLSGNKEEQKSIVNILYGIEEADEKGKITAYESGEAYEEARRRILEEGGN